MKTACCIEYYKVTECHSYETVLSKHIINTIVWTLGLYKGQSIKNFIKTPTER